MAKILPHINKLSPQHKIIFTHIKHKTPHSIHILPQQVEFYNLNVDILLYNV